MKTTNTLLPAAFALAAFLAAYFLGNEFIGGLAVGIAFGALLRA